MSVDNDRLVDAKTIENSHPTAPAQAGAVATIGKFLTFAFMLALWFFIGGFFTLGPRIAHNIEHAVGSFALVAPVLAWITLPFTGAAALIAMNKTAGQVFLGNLLLWLGLVGYLFISWSNAYP